MRKQEKKRARQTKSWLRTWEGQAYLRSLNERPASEAAEVRRMLAGEKGQRVYGEEEP